jgi:diguanylate cyclase (GGDEF)-like protein
MKRFARSELLVATFWTGWRRLVVYATCITSIFFLGGLRSSTDAELAFASLAMLPVLIIAWLGGRWPGLSMALLAAAMWSAADIHAERQFSAPWIPWLNGMVRFLTYGLVVLLTAQVRLQYARERQHATRDPLTGLLNRRAFLVAGDTEVERARRYEGPFTVIFMDLDCFKVLNDTKGHAMGDEALQATATALVGATRNTDLVARMGGDEFAIVFPEIDFEAAVSAANKLFNAVSCALEKYPPVSVSVGVAWFQVADQTFLTMLRIADDLMYIVKADGKSKVLSRRFPESKI